MSIKKNLVIWVIALVFAAPPLVASGSVSITETGSAYTENFDTLASAGTSNVVPNGWAFSETGTNANTSYTAGDGSSNTGDTYSFGQTGISERAFGTLLSNSLFPSIGASFTNNTGHTISRLTISYAGEQWRLGALGRTDRLDFQYSSDATGLGDGSWSDVDGLDFSSLDTSSSVGAKDGNSLRQTVSSTIPDLNIPPGETFWIRWNDFNTASADDGLAVDDFSLVALSVPTVTTQAVTCIGTDIATGNGNITDFGGLNPTAHGVVWNTTGAPTLADNRTDEGAAVFPGPFTSEMTGLSPGTTYYVRAYATNTAGTGYGDEVMFSTVAPVAAIPTLSEWGMILFALLMAGAVMVSVRRRKRAV